MATMAAAVEGSLAHLAMLSHYRPLTFNGGSLSNLQLGLEICVNYDLIINFGQKHQTSLNSCISYSYHYSNQIPQNFYEKFIHDK